MELHEGALEVSLQSSYIELLNRAPSQSCLIKPFHRAPLQFLLKAPLQSSFVELLRRAPLQSSCIERVWNRYGTSMERVWNKCSLSSSLLFSSPFLCCHLICSHPLPPLLSSRPVPYLFHTLLHTRSIKELYELYERAVQRNFIQELYNGALHKATL